MTVKESKPTADELKALREIRMCVDRRLPAPQASAAERGAIAERPDNLRVQPFRRGAGPGRARMAIIVASEWKPGTTLHVRFLDGDTVVKQRVEMVAHGWEDHANIKFEFGNRQDAEIRISFKEEGSWSYVGRDALQIAKTQPTMNYGWLTATTADDEYSRVVLHEFGHALGCIHEHQSPGVTIPWDTAAVYAYYALQGWSHADTDQNVLIPYSPEGMQFSMFDRKSIMLYAVDDRLTIGTWSVGWNRELSETDKSFIRSRYPKEERPIVPITIGTPADGAIASAGEVDWYQFAVGAAGRYLIETAGATDTVASLHGPDTRTAIIAADDDSGPGLNARIERDLQPATYYIQVRHYGLSGVGQYQLQVHGA